MTKSEAIATELHPLLEPIDSPTTSLNLLSTHSEIEQSSQVGFNAEDLSPKPTYVEVGIEKLTSLANALGMGNKIAQIVEIFRVMTVSWGDRKIGEHAGWQSDVSDDFTPFEFSIAFKEGRAELRVLIEAQGSEPNLQSNWQAGLNLNQSLAERYNISLDRFEKIEDLFVPTNPIAKFSVWHTACFAADKEPSFKIYLNPQAKGASLAAAVVEESLVRLDFDRAWSTLAQTAAQRGPDKDEFVYFSLDLDADDRSRVKTYLRHIDATVDDLEKALSAAGNYVAGAATEFCQAMVAEQTTFSAKPAITCFAFIEGDGAIPSNGTIYIPISNYANNDLVVRERVDGYFSQYGLPVRMYYSAIQAFAVRPLIEGVGMHSYIALCPGQQHRRVSIYLNPEVNAVRPLMKIGVTQSPRSLASLEEMVSRYEGYTVDHHPFLQRLQREPVNPQHLWLLFMNLREAAMQFSRRLVNIIARIEDDRIRCILAKQLNDELGNGDIDGIHTKLYDRLMTSIESWRVDSFTEDMLIPGKEFSQRLEEIYSHVNPYMAVGAAIVMEFHGKQFVLRLGQEFRKTNVSLSDIIWLTLHEELEVDHVDESLLLAQFVADSEEGVSLAKEGIESACLASWGFLDGLYRLCFN